MTTDAILESGMRFGPYPAGQCFYIEKSQSYKRIEEGVQIAEFLLLHQKAGQPPVVWIIEAKSSSPNPANPVDFPQYIDDIRCKLTNAFLLCIAARLNRHNAPADAPANELPAPFQALDLQHTGFRFVLVINGHKEEWLAPVQEALSLALKPVVKTWVLPPFSVVVLNHDLAAQNGLVTPATTTPQ